MSKLFENYIEAALLKNEDLHKQARQSHNVYGKEATVVGRVLLEIVHARMLILDVDRSVMELVYEKIQTGKESGEQLPPLALYPVPPSQPLLIDFLAARVVRRNWGLPPIAGMALECPRSPDVVREAKGLLPAKYHDSVDGTRNEVTERWPKIPGLKITPILCPRRGLPDDHLGILHHKELQPNGFSTRGRMSSPAPLLALLLFLAVQQFAR